MNDLRSIARERSQAAMALHLAALPKDVKALQQELAAKGLLKSGNMLRGVLSIGQSALNAQAAALSEHYTWAVTESLAATSSWVGALSREAEDSLKPLLDLGAEQIAKACALAQQPNLADRLLNDLRTTHAEARKNIDLALQASYAIKSRDLLKQLGGFLKRLVSLGGGK